MRESATEISVSPHRAKCLAQGVKRPAPDPAAVAEPGALSARSCRYGPEEPQLAGAHSTAHRCVLRGFAAAPVARERPCATLVAPARHRRKVRVSGGEEEGIDGAGSVAVSVGASGVRNTASNTSAQLRRDAIPRRQPHPTAGPALSRAPRAHPLSAPSPEAVSYADAARARPTADFRAASCRLRISPPNGAPFRRRAPRFETYERIRPYAYRLIRVDACVPKNPNAHALMRVYAHTMMEKKNPRNSKCLCACAQTPLQGYDMLPNLRARAMVRPNAEDRCR